MQALRFEFLANDRVISHKSNAINMTDTEYRCRKTSSITELNERLKRSVSSGIITLPWLLSECDK